MAESSQHAVPFRRRQEQQTDYQNRLELLKSGTPRAVVRISNKHAQAQFVVYDRDGDETVTAATSRHLEDYGWDYHTGNLAAAYLTGYLAGKRALADGIEDAVADLGITTRKYGGRHYAVVKGLRDAGVEVPADESVLPSEDRVNGEHADAHESDGITDAVAAVRETIDEEVQ